MKLSAIAKHIGATMHGKDMTLPPVAIDSRKLQPGEMFVAIQGENYDGHDYIADAIAKGALAIMAKAIPAACQTNQITFLEVQDTVSALGQLAALWRQQYALPIVGLTGSCGKTTVKGMIEAICAQHGKTLATAGNFNNHIGLPLMLLRLDATYDYAVIEMGANHMGEIAYLGKIAKPTISLITNVRPAHLEGFGSVENVALAKGEIYSALSEEGVAVVNVDEPLNKTWTPLIAKRNTITFGLQDEAMVKASQIQHAPFSVEFTVTLPNHETSRVKVNIPGLHTVYNALSAIAVGFALKIPLSKMILALEQFEGVKGRLRQMTGLNNARIIDDTYNANPGSVRAALDVLANCPGNKIFVMGNMGELGENTEHLHADIGQYAREKGIAKLLAVGSLTPHMVKAFGIGATWYATKADLLQDLTALLNAQTTILIKGSRSARMEEITQALIMKKEA